LEAYAVLRVSLLLLTLALPACASVDPTPIVHRGLNNPPPTNQGDCYIMTNDQAWHRC
jgi:hypothetical protein